MACCLCPSRVRVGVAATWANPGGRWGVGMPYIDSCCATSEGAAGTKKKEEEKTRHGIASQTTRHAPFHLTMFCRKCWSYPSRGCPMRP